eukprot:TRINITY_DN2586_c0_g1_i1.p1 TRINITY_DN2586_c0_g1~~TRINITY_DN2586_c0_g1_i1.p1  ORF type:complete len:165 (-),score=60.60 TRINITY_DN2586_c0_g1_i1:217-663(-)
MSYLSIFVLVVLFQLSFSARPPLPKLSPEQAAELKDKLKTSPLYQTIQEYQQRVKQMSDVLSKADEIIRKRKDEEEEKEIFGDLDLFPEERQQQEKEVADLLKQTRDLIEQKENVKPDPSDKLQVEEYRKKVKALKQLLENDQPAEEN